AWRLKKEFIPGPLAAECLAHLGWSYAVSQTGHAFAEPGGHGRTVTGGDNTDDNRVQEDTPGISRTPEDHTSSSFPDHASPHLLHESFRGYSASRASSTSVASSFMAIARPRSRRGDGRDSSFATV